MSDTSTLDELQATQEELEALAALRDRRSRKALGAAPGIVMHIRTMIDGAGGRSERGVDIAEESTPLITGWVDDADELYAQLINWVMYWAETLKDEAPATARVWANQREPQGFRAGTTPLGADALTRAHTMWLLIRADRIAKHQSGTAYQDDIIRMVSALRGKYPTAPRPEKPVSPRPCPKCGHFAVTAHWNSEELHDVVVSCEHCENQIATRPTDVERWLSA